MCVCFEGIFDFYRDPAPSCCFMELGCSGKKGKKRRPSVAPSMPAASVSGFNDKEMSPLIALRTEAGEPLAFGSVRFQGSKAPPTKFARLSRKSDVRLVVRLLIETYNAPPPSSIISVIGRCVDHPRSPLSSRDAEDSSGTRHDGLTGVKTDAPPRQ